MLTETNNKLKPYKAHISNEKRLIELLPLGTPLSILIDPCNICNFKCTFCPTSDAKLLKSVGRPKGIMDFNLFCKIIEDIKEFKEKIKRLHLYKDGEPFLNKDLSSMISCAKQSNVADYIETTTNASLISKNVAKEIIEAGLDVIRISIEHINDDGYKKVTGSFSDYEMIRKNVEYLFNLKQKMNSSLKIHAKIIDVGLSDSEKHKFIQDFSNISDSINIDTLMGWSNSDIKDFTLGNESTIKTNIDSNYFLKKDRKVCPEPFKTMSINFNGLVSVCCVDWSLGTVIGDVNNESLFNIWNGEKLQRFRILHLSQQRNQIKACSNCHYIQGMRPISDLDGYTEDLLKVYNNI